MLVGTSEALATIALPIALYGVSGTHTRHIELVAVPLLVAGAGPELANTLRTILDATPPQRVSLFDTHPPLAARIGRVTVHDDPTGTQ